MAQPLECCICHTSLGDDAQRIGQRAYCDRHFGHVAQDRRGLWASTGAGIFAVLLFVGIVALVVRATPARLDGLPLLVTSVVLALVPALLWLGVFYRLDRLEPEPKRHVISIFVLGALLAQGAALPLLRGLFQVQEWLGTTSTLLNVAGSILIVGFVQEYLKYAGVRHTIFNSPEFDERVDGIIYGVAAGLGFATMLNLNYVLESGGVRLDVGAVRIAITTLAHASFAGVSGYFLGRAKFEDMPAWWLPLGVTLAATLNGVVSATLREVSTQGLRYTPSYGLLVAAAVAGGVFVLLFTIIRRINAATLAARDRVSGV